MYTDPMGTGERDIVYVNFFEGPAGIQAALDANPDEPNAVLASGWGAANASLLLLAAESVVPGQHRVHPGQRRRPA